MYRVGLGYQTCHVTDVAIKTSQQVSYIMLTEDGGPGLDKLLSKASVKFKSVTKNEYLKHI